MGIVLYYIVLYSIVLYCTVLYCIKLYRILLCCIVLYCATFSSGIPWNIPQVTCIFGYTHESLGECIPRKFR